MGISRSSAVASFPAKYAGSLRTQRLRDSYQFNVNQLDALLPLGAVSAIHSSLLAAPSESINTASFSTRYTASTDVRLSTTGKVQSTLSDLKTSLAALVSPALRVPVQSVSSDEFTALADDTARTTLTLQATGHAEVINMRDNAMLSARVKQLTEAMNTAHGQLLGLNDGLAQREVQRLRDSLNATGSDSEVNRLTLADFGVGTGSEGEMTLNEAKLATVVEKNPEGVAGALADASSRLVQTIQSSLDENSGLNITLNSLRSQFSTGSAYVQQNSGFSLLQGVPGYSIPTSVQEDLRRYLSIAQL